MIELILDKNNNKLSLYTGKGYLIFMKNEFEIWRDHRNRDYPDMISALVMSDHGAYHHIFSDHEIHEHSPQSEKMEKGKIYIMGWNPKVSKSSLILFTDSHQIKLQESGGYWFCNFGEVSADEWTEKERCGVYGADLYFAISSTCEKLYNLMEKTPSQSTEK